jgi:tyrosyl-tRNA synthetase
MSIPDALMRDWMTYFTDLPPERVEALCDASRTHPREAKEALAKGVVTRYHGREAANEAADEFRRVFSEKSVPADMAEVGVTAPIAAAALVLQCLPDKSKSAVQRLIEQGAVTLDGAKLSDPRAPLDPKDGAVLKVGKLEFFRIRRS